MFTVWKLSAVRLESGGGMGEGGERQAGGGGTHRPLLFAPPRKAVATHTNPVLVGKAPGQTCSQREGERRKRTDQPVLVPARQCQAEVPVGLTHSHRGAGYVMGVRAEPGRAFLRQGIGGMMKTRFVPLSGKFGFYFQTTLSGE